jgi:hypothetical protein
MDTNGGLSGFECQKPFSRTLQLSAPIRRGDRINGISRGFLLGNQLQALRDLSFLLEFRGSNEFFISLRGGQSSKVPDQLVMLSSQNPRLRLSFAFGRCLERFFPEPVSNEGLKIVGYAPAVMPDFSPLHEVAVVAVPCHACDPVCDPNAQDL